jgi:glycerophosphoryl diester phosphodiesterase
MMITFALPIALCLPLVVQESAQASMTVVGHRGAPAELPESTLSGFAVALESAELVELDVRATKDGVLVVHHDAVTRDGTRIRDATFATLRTVDVGAVQRDLHPKQRALPGAQIPTLDEILALVRTTANTSKARIIVELKADDAPAPAVLAELVVATLDRSHARARVIVESFDPALVRAMKERAPDVARGLLCVTCDARALLIAQDLAARIVSPAHDRIDRAFVDAAHARDLRVVAWTANDAASWQRLRALDVDAIITDDPRALRRVVESW